LPQLSSGPLGGAENSMRKLKYLLLLIIASSFLFSMGKNERERFYYFYYDISNNREILKTIPVDLPLNTETKSVVDSLLKYLSDKYFYKAYYLKGATNINLVLLKIDSIITKTRIYKIATVDIVDTSRICMGAFFQGSTGGHMTTVMLGTNILQPQFYYASPFLDGLILLYNGSPLYNMDHIKIDDILVPKNYFDKAMDAINQNH
jgi:hypothetical protein